MLTVERVLPPQAHPEETTRERLTFSMPSRNIDQVSIINRIPTNNLEVLSRKTHANTTVYSCTLKTTFFSSLAIWRNIYGAKNSSGSFQRETHDLMYFLFCIICNACHLYSLDNANGKNMQVPKLFLDKTYAKVLHKIVLDKLQLE